MLPTVYDDPYPGYAPCPCCFESCGYVCEFGNDWNDGPYVYQTRVPCSECEGTGMVEAEPVTFDDLVNEADERMASLDDYLTRLAAEPILPGSDVEAMVTRPAATVAGSVNLLTAVQERAA